MKKSTVVCQNRLVLCAQRPRLQLSFTVTKASSMKLHVPLPPPRTPHLVFKRTSEGFVVLVLVVWVQITSLASSISINNVSWLEVMVILYHQPLNSLSHPNITKPPPFGKPHTPWISHLAEESVLNLMGKGQRLFLSQVLADGHHLFVLAKPTT